LASVETGKQRPLMLFGIFLLRSFDPICCYFCRRASAGQLNALSKALVFNRIRLKANDFRIPLKSFQRFADTVNATTPARHARGR
jgi:hypothetical protein